MHLRRKTCIGRNLQLLTSFRFVKNHICYYEGSIEFSRASPRKCVSTHVSFALMRGAFRVPRAVVSGDEMM